MKVKKQIVGNESERSLSESFIKKYRDSPMPPNDELNNLGLFLRRQQMSRIIFMYELYKKILDVHGVIMEFGVRWGQNLALFESFRGMLEPYNYTRKIIGFDTFEGFPSVSAKDKPEINFAGDMKVSAGYEDYLDALLQLHESASPNPHIKKYELIKGNAIKTCKKYLADHPETIIAFAYFDFDIYEPTKACLELCKDRLTKGSILAFDELNHPDWPGETLALKEVLGIDRYKIHRMPFMPTISYIVVG